MKNTNKTLIFNVAGFRFARVDCARHTAPAAARIRAAAGGCGYTPNSFIIRA